MVGFRALDAAKCKRAGLNLVGYAGFKNDAKKGSSFRIAATEAGALDEYMRNPREVDMHHYHEINDHGVHCTVSFAAVSP